MGLNTLLARDLLVGEFLRIRKSKFDLDKRNLLDSQKNLSHDGKAEFDKLHINFYCGEMTSKKCTNSAEADTLATMDVVSHLQIGAQIR